MNEEEIQAKAQEQYQIRMAEKKLRQINPAWYLIALLIPILGLVAGLYYSGKGKNGLGLMGISILAAIFWWFILMAGL